ncbi:MAG TPA: sigma-70 family RNA polymerase sigma factor [Algoriphagus sp.]|nr:sigma-70 family RNA polymerase sigma factor [Algoriphagus sp.]
MNSHSSLDSFFRDPDDCWKLLKAGNKLGLEGLYQIYSKDLFRFGISIVGDEDFVQDCIQEIFIDLWKYHKTLQTANNVKVYLFKTLSRRISKESNLGKKRRTVEIKDSNTAGYCIESIESEIIDQQRDVELQKKLANGLQRLPSRQREVLVYLFFENFTYEQISKIMGINLRSVYTLAWKALSALKKNVYSLSIFLLSLLFNFLLIFVFGF